MKANKRKQMSESFLMVAFLSLSGGLQDAYTYVFRGNVFANAQTGNIVLLSQNIISRKWDGAIHYLIPLISFAIGIIAAEMVRARFKQSRKIHWRQLVLILEILLLFAVAFLPSQLNIVANAIVSFSCAMQVQTFRKVNGYPFASTMCIGNIRSGMDSLYAYMRTRDKDILQKTMCYFGIIFLFACGAGIGEYFIQFMGAHTIWLSCGFLFISFMFMFIKEEIDEHSPA